MDQIGSKPEHGTGWEQNAHALCKAMLLPTPRQCEDLDINLTRLLMLAARASSSTSE